MSRKTTTEEFIERRYTKEKAIYSVIGEWTFDKREKAYYIEQEVLKETIKQG